MKLENTKNPSLNWTSYIRNCISHKKPRAAISVYIQNRANGNIIFGVIPLVLKAPALLCMINLGKSLHCEAIKSGAESDVMVGTSLIDMYSKCRDVRSSRKVFDSMPERNAVAWNAMIAGYMRNGDAKSALVLFQKMKSKNSVTWNEVIDGYVKRGDMGMAKRLFDSMPEKLKNVVTWTSMIEGYANKGDMEVARGMFDVMKERNFYVWSIMITGYFKKGEVEKAREIFDRTDSRNLVIWNSLVSGYSQNGLCEAALDAFKRLRADGFEPDEFTFVSVLSACAQTGRLDVGKEIHEMIIEKGIELNEFLLNGLTDMYVKCGDLSNARLIFEGMPRKNTSSWNVLISGFAIHGHCAEAVELFSRMEESAVKPDDVTFLSVLSACAHGGLVEEGLETFCKIKQYGLTASIKHYGCLVDLLGRAGKLQEAFELVKIMPLKPNDTMLGALLGACRIHSDTIMAERVVELVCKLYSSSDDAHFVLLSNIYASSERWEKAEGMRAVMLNNRCEKTPGCSKLVIKST